MADEYVVTLKEAPSLFAKRKKSVTEFYKKWVEVLPTYPKTVNHLKTKEGYCVLGVGMEVCGIPSKYDPEYDHYIYDDRVCSLSPRAMELLGLGDDLGSFYISELSEELREKIPSDCHNLANINDATDTWDLVLDVLKEAPPSLFAQEPANGDT